LRKRSDRGAKNNCDSNSFDERFHETTSRECLLRAADVTCGAADGDSLGVDQARINPPFMNSLLLLTRQWQKPTHQGFAGVHQARRGSSDQTIPGAHSINAGYIRTRRNLSLNQAFVVSHPAYAAHSLALIPLRPPRSSPPSQ
jgi:hypothetical protein